MGLFSQILEGDSEADLYADPYASGTRRPRIKAADPVLRKTIQDVQPGLEEKSVGGFLGNAVEDVGRLAGGLGAILGQVLVHPIKSAEAVGSAALDPVGTAKMLAEPIIENYTPKEGESVPSMMLRRAYEHPFDTLMDASFIVGGPAGIGAKLARATGAERTAALMSDVAAAAASVDPITQAQRGGRYLLKTNAPDAYARMRTSSALADAGATEATRQEYLVHQYNTKLKEIDSQLNPAEMQVRFPYAEGRVPIVKDDMITELTHRGQYESRKVQEGISIDPAKLDAWRDAYVPLQQEYERMAGIDPETVARNAADDFAREIEKKTALDPNHVPEMTPEDVYQTNLAEGQTRQVKRSARSTMTALDVAKEAKFRETAADLAIKQQTFDLNEISAMLPREAETTVAEAMDLMGPKGGIIIPHSTEVMTRDQSTVGNILTKLGESSVYKENAGAKFAGGHLQNLDPSAALSRYYVAAVRGHSFGKVVGDAAEAGLKEGFVTDITGLSKAAFDPINDPRLTSGTHQILHPGSLHLDGSIQEHFDRVSARLHEVAEFDEGVRGVNMGDIAEGIAKAADETFPLNKEMSRRTFLVPKGMGDAIAMYKKSFEPATNPFALFSDKWMMQPYNLLNLSAKGTRVLNNGYGNTEFITMQGLHPFSFRGWDAFLTAGRATAGKFQLPGFRDATSQKLAKMFELPGISGGLAQTEAFSAARGLGDRIAEGTVLPRFGKVSNNPLTRTFGKYTQMISNANSNLEDIYRVASTVYELKPGGLESVRNLIHGSASMASFADRVDELAKMGVAAMDEPVLKAATKNMNRWLNDYKRTTAVERSIGRHVFPYHKFYKHSAELLVRFPFEAPIKGQIARAIGGAAINDAKEILKSYGFDWDTMVPDFLRDSIPIKKVEAQDGSPQVLMLNTKGPNPFSFLAGNDVGEQALGALHPLAKIAIEQATGINMFTREKFQGPLSTFSGRKVDPETGSIVEDYARPNLADQYLRQFWPYQTIRDLAAHGRVANDTATLLDMLGKGAPGTYQVDDRGLQRRKYQPFGAATPLVRMFGPIPQTLQVPTKKQTAGRKAITSSQFADLLQQHPEAREQILAALRANAQAYRPQGSPVAPRRF